MNKKFLFIIIILLLCINIISAKELIKKEIYFYPDSDDIKTNSLPDMEELLNILKNIKEYLITLKGYTNSVGSPGEELELSKRRANRIALFLNNNGISLSKIKSEGYGSQNLKENKITEKNRRVEVFIYTSDKEVKIDDKYRKFKISVLNEERKEIYASILIKYLDNNKAHEEEHKINEPRVIDIPFKDKIEMQVSSPGYKDKKIIITIKEDEKIVYLEKKGSKQKNRMVYVEGGTFIMGDERNSGYKDELPLHKVTVDSFYIGIYEVTQSEWEDVMGYNPSDFKSKDLPVHNITWYEAIEYCNKRSIKEGLKPYYKIYKDKNDPDNKNKNSDKYCWMIECNVNANGYRLPTEAEYEYAARGGNKSKGYKYSGSSIVNDVTKDFTKILIEKNMGNNDLIMKEKTVEKLIVQKNGMNIPNELNIFDMSNNIYEWCWDWYDKNYYKKSEKNNPLGAKEGSERVLRGGLCKEYRDDCRVSARQKAEPYKKYYQKTDSSVSEGRIYTYFVTNIYIGLRVVRNAK